ncbi:MAG: hypothetical protein AAGF13_10740 [Pseudomonadota bacterium]
MRIAALLIALFVAGCTANAPITQDPVRVAFADQRLRAQVTGIDSIFVRTRLESGGTMGELASVPCRISGPGYDASFVTPVILELPTFARAAPTLSLSCRFEGETKTRALKAINLTERKRRNLEFRARQQLIERDFRDLFYFRLELAKLRRFPDDLIYPNTTFTFAR